MKTQHAIDKAGGARQLAALLDITPSAVSQWGEDVPEARVWQLRVLRPSWFEECTACAASATSERTIVLPNS